RPRPAVKSSIVWTSFFCPGEFFFPDTRKPFSGTSRATFLFLGTVLLLCPNPFHRKRQKNRRSLKPQRPSCHLPADGVPVYPWCPARIQKAGCMKPALGMLLLQRVRFMINKKAQALSG